MKRTIYKYPIEITDIQQVTVKMAVGSTAKIVHAGLDPSGFPCIWVEHTPGESFATFNVHIVGTGRSIPNNCTHKGSFIMDIFVWHVYT